MIDKAYTKFDTFKTCWNPKVTAEKGRAIKAHPGVAKLTRIFQTLLPVILVGIAVITLAQFHGAWKWTLTHASNTAQFARFGTLPLVVLVMIAIGAGTYENHRRSLAACKSNNITKSDINKTENEIIEINTHQLYEMSEIGKQIRELIHEDFQAFKKDRQRVLDKSLVTQFEELLKRGMQIDKNFINYGMFGSVHESQTLIQYLTILEVNDRYIGLIDILEKCALQQKVALNLSEYDRYGNTPLIWAIAQGSHAIVAKLLDMSEKHNWSLFLDQCSDVKLTPGNSALILLVAKGYSKRTGGYDPWNVGKNTAWVLAERMLALGANPNLANVFGYSAIDYAVARADKEMIKILINNKAKCENTKFNEISGKIYTVEHDDDSIKMMLVKATSFCDDNVRQECYQCPLFNAASFLNEYNKKEIEQWIKQCLENSKI